MTTAYTEQPKHCTLVVVACPGSSRRGGEVAAFLVFDGVTCVFVYLHIMCKIQIGTIHRVSCTNLGSQLCIANLWTICVLTYPFQRQIRTVIILVYWSTRLCCPFLVHFRRNGVIPHLLECNLSFGHPRQPLDCLVIHILCTSLGQSENCAADPRIVVQSLDLKFMQDNLQIVPVCTLCIS